MFDELNYQHPRDYEADTYREIDRLNALNAEMLSALKRMVAMHSLMMARADHGACFWDAESITEMNEAPLQAAAAIARAEDGR